MLRVSFVWGWHFLIALAIGGVPVSAPSAAFGQEEIEDWMEPSPLEGDPATDPIEDAAETLPIDELIDELGDAELAAVSSPADSTPPASSVTPESDIELIRERYPDGTVKVEREVALDPHQNYVNHGRWTMWDQKGVMIARGEYRMGKQHGTWTRWYTASQGKMFKQPVYALFQGPFRAEITLRDGELDGTWTVFDSQNRKASQWEFAGGQRHGKSIWWYPSGQPQREVSFSNGQLDGELVDYDPQQKQVRRILYVKGRELVKDMAVFSDTHKKHEGWVLRSRMIKDPIHDWWEGNVELSADPKPARDVRHGKWLFWHANGVRRVEGEYNVGRRAGDWTWWHDNGQVLAKGTYNDGQPHGRWTWWYDTGHRKTTGKYERGLEQGVWSSWDQNGQLAQIQDYSTPSVDEESNVTEVAEKPARPVEDVPVPDLSALRKSIDGTVLR